MSALTIGCYGSRAVDVPVRIERPLSARSYRSPMAQALAGSGTPTGHSW